jgi:hypothetical protein
MRSNLLFAAELEVEGVRAIGDKEWSLPSLLEHYIRWLKVIFKALTLLVVHRFPLLNYPCLRYYISFVPFHSAYLEEIMD